MSQEPTTGWWPDLRARIESRAYDLVERVPSPVRGSCRFAYQVAIRFTHSGSNVIAAAIAFYGVVCLTPLGIIAVAALQHLAGTRYAAASELEQLIRQMSPAGAADIVQQVDSLLAFPDPAITGGLGALALLWAGTRLFDTITRALNALWHDSRQRGFWVRQLIGFITMLAAGAGLTSYMVVVSAAARAREWLTLAGVPPDRSLLAFKVTPVLVAIPFTWLAFLLLYKLIPTRHVSNRAAAGGALAATIGLLIAQPVFALFIGRSAHAHSMYGALTSVVVFALWMYAVAQLLLFGAHVAAQIEGVPVVPMEGGRQPFSLGRDEESGETPATEEA
jgi:membrane protein